MGEVTTLAREQGFVCGPRPGGKEQNIKGCLFLGDNLFLSALGNYQLKKTALAVFLRLIKTVQIYRSKFRYPTRTRCA